MLPRCRASSSVRSRRSRLAPTTRQASGLRLSASAQAGTTGAAPGSVHTLCTPAAGSPCMQACWVGVAGANGLPAAAIGGTAAADVASASVALSPLPSRPVIAARAGALAAAAAAEAGVLAAAVAPVANAAFTAASAAAALALSTSAAAASSVAAPSSKARSSANPFQLVAASPSELGERLVARGRLFAAAPAASAALSLAPAAHWPGAACPSRRWRQPSGEAR